MTDPDAPNVKGITKADYQTWKHHPVSELFFGFLVDKRAFFERSALDRWIAGNLSLVEDQTIRGQIVEMVEAEQLAFEDIHSFYKPEEENYEAEAPEDDGRAVHTG